MMVAFNDFSVRFQLTQNEALFIEKTLDQYSYKSIFQGLVCRLVNLVKYIFGRSDWQRSLEIMTPRAEIVLKGKIQLPAPKLLAKAVTLSSFFLNYFRIVCCIQKDAHWVYEEPGIISEDDWDIARNLSLDELIERAPFGNGLTAPLLSKENEQLFVNKEKELHSKSLEFFEAYLRGIQEESADPTLDALKKFVEVSKDIYNSPDISLASIRAQNCKNLALIEVLSDGT